MTLFKDVRYGIRKLGRSPGFTVPVVLTLALGIGANVALFSVVRGVLVSPLGFDEPERLAMIWSGNPSQGLARFGVSSPDLLDWSARARGFERIAAFQQRSGTLLGAERPERVAYAVVTRDFFRTLGVEPARGSLETWRETVAPVAVSHGLWSRLLGGAADAVGRSLTLDGRPCVVAAILPAHFEFPSSEITLWRLFDPAEDINPRGARWLTVVGRLASGTTVRQAQVEMDVLAKELEHEHPDTNDGWGVLVEPLHEAVVGPVRAGLLVVWSSVGIVLVMVCANVANLLLARGRAREREIAIRSALGAGRGVLVRQLLTESMVLAVAGGALALPLALWGVEVLSHLGQAFVPRIDRIRIDQPTLAFAAALTAATGLAFGMLPALRSARCGIRERLAGSTGPGTGSARLTSRAPLVALEIALATIVLVGAGLLVRSFAGLMRIDPGFRSEDLLTMRIEPPFASDPPESGDPMEWYAAERAGAAAFYRAVVERMESVPGVRSVSAVNRLPLTGNWWISSIEIEGRRSDRVDGRFTSSSRAVLPGYFETMGIPVVRGREFVHGDDGNALPVAVVNRAAATTLWPGEDPIGKRFGVHGPPDPVWYTIVGIAGDVRLGGLATPPRPTTYVPMPQAVEGFNSNWGMDVVVRTDSALASVVDPLRVQVQAVNGDLPVFDIRPMERIIHGSVAARRFYMLLLGLMGALTFTLAVVGVHGVVSYSLSQRLQELAIRTALGARGRDVIRLVLGQVLGVAAAGIAAGLVGAFALTRFLTGLLHGVTPTDPATFVAIVALLVAAALGASSFPLRRALRIDPARALRSE